MSASVDPILGWTCAGCLTRQPVESTHCAACGRGRNAEAFLRAAKRAVVIAIGIALQIACGVLLWLHPPGSPLAWLVYMGVATIGAVHILAGALLWRSPPATDGHRAPVVAFIPGDLPFHMKRCGSCGSELAETIASGRRRCPRCGAHFRLADFGWMREDPAGEPHSLAPRERRLDGRLVAAFFALMLILVLAGLHLLTIASTPAPPGP